MRGTAHISAFLGADNRWRYFIILQQALFLWLWALFSHQSPESDHLGNLRRTSDVARLPSMWRIFLHMEALWGGLVVLLTERDIGKLGWKCGLGNVDDTSLSKASTNPAS